MIRRPRLAIELFVYRIGREIGSLTAALGGLDAVVFTAGIGQNAPVIRSRICRSAAWLGLEIDETANTANRTCISTPSSPRLGLGHPDRRGNHDRASHPTAG